MQKKSWNRSYLSLVDNHTIEGDERKTAYVSWISPQSVPPVLWPYTAGAARSPLVTMLEEGHEGVTMTREEMERLSGKRTVPQIFIDGQSIGGFDELYELEQEGELDRLLNT